MLPKFSFHAYATTEAQLLQNYQCLFTRNYDMTEATKLAGELFHNINNQNSFV